MKKKQIKTLIIKSIFSLLSVFFCFLLLSPYITVSGYLPLEDSGVSSLSNLKQLSENEFKNINQIFSLEKKSIIFVTTNWCGVCTKKIRDVYTHAIEHSDIDFYYADLESNRDFMNGIQVYLPESFIFIDGNSYSVLDNLDTNLLPQKINQFKTTGISFI